MLAAEITKGADRVIYFDPMRDYARYANAREMSLDEIIAKSDVLEQPKFRIAIVPGDEPADDLEEVIIISRAVGNLVLVLDEVGDYRQKAEHLLNRLARNGRHDGIVPIYVSQVAVDIPLTVRRLATRVFSFLQVNKEDIDALSKQYGESFAERVATCEAHEKVTWILPTLPQLLLTKTKPAEPRDGFKSTPKSPSQS